MRREYVGNAPKARLTVLLGGSPTNLTITCDDLANWPTGTGGKPFYVVIDRNTTSEEKILCASRAGNVLTVFDNGITNGRGADDTTITSHSVNSIIEHVFTATDADEANALVNLLTTPGDLLVYGATGNTRLPVGTDNDILIADSTESNGVRWGTPQSTFDIINPFLLMGA